MRGKRSRLLIGLCGGIALWGGLPVFANGENLSDTILKAVNYFPKDLTLADGPQKQTIISNFCQMALSPAVISDFLTVYPGADPRQSLFLRIICSKSGLDASFSSFMSDQNEEGNYLNTYAIRLLTPQSAACHGQEYQRSCDISKLSEELITLILEELTLLKQANLYGVTMNNLTSNARLEENIDTFTREKLLIHYVDQQSFCKSKTQGYPETCKIMKKSMRAFQKAFTSFRLINIEKLLPKTLDTFKTKQASCSQNPNAADYDHLFCEILGVTDEGLDPFITRVYTELLRYQLFVTHYAEHLWTRDPSEMNEASRYEYVRIQSFQKTLMPTINTTLKQLSDLQNSYPIHIGMLAYQEELLRLRDKYLSKLVAPFYSVFYKLQNVQIKN